jgi:hypothetical protein
LDTLTAAARREVLRDKLDAAVQAITMVATSASLKGDPLTDLLKALGVAIEGLAEIYEASAETQQEIAGALTAQAGTTARAATQETLTNIRAAVPGIMDQLAPQIAGRIEAAVNRQAWTMRLRTVFFGGTTLIAGFLVLGMVSYGAGYASGRTNGELLGHTISAAMAAGPEAAAKWASLMAWNDPTKGLASCKRSIQADTNGRRYCAMPVWLDPPSPGGS